MRRRQPTQIRGTCPRSCRRGARGASEGARCLERNAARESERAWREELHAADDEDDGGEDAPNLRIIGKDAKGEGGGKGRAPWPLWMVQLTSSRNYELCRGMGWVNVVR